MTDKIEADISRKQLYIDEETFNKFKKDGYYIINVTNPNIDGILLFEGCENPQPYSTEYQIKIDFQGRTYDEVIEQINHHKKIYTEALKKHIKGLGGS